MREIGNHILAVIGIFGLLSIPLVIDSCKESEETVVNTVSLETESYDDNFTFEVDSLRPEHIADTYVETTTEELEEATSFMSEEGQDAVYSAEATDELVTISHDEESTEPLVVVADSFNEAFQVARVHLGPGKQWIWDANGITYTTFYAEEKAKYDSLQATYWTEEELTSGTDLVEVEVSEQY